MHVKELNLNAVENANGHGREIVASGFGVELSKNELKESEAIRDGRNAVGRFAKGNTLSVGNGRPKDSKSKLNHLRDKLVDAYLEEGQDGLIYAVRRLRESRPSDALGLLSKLLPKDINIDGPPTFSQTVINIDTNEKSPLGDSSGLVEGEFSGG